MTSRPSRLTSGQRGFLLALTAAVVVTAIVLGTVVVFSTDPPPIDTTTTETLAPTTAATIAPTTTTTIAATTTTTVPETTTTVPETTTTTIAIRESFVLRPDGIDRLFFGEDPDTVVAELTERIGDPSADTNWVDQQERFDGLCGGTEARFVTWETLQVFFTDRETAWAPEGTRHFASYAVGAGAEDLEFMTTRDIGLGSTVEEIEEAYGSEVVFEESPLYETEVFEVDPPGDGYLLGFLTGLDDDDIAVEIVGGFSCGE